MVIDGGTLGQMVAANGGGRLRPTMSENGGGRWQPMTVDGDRRWQMVMVSNNW